MSLDQVERGTGRQKVELPRGLECRHCGCRDLRVLHTRQRPGGIMRVRICRHCGRCVITHEIAG